MRNEKLRIAALNDDDTNLVVGFARLDGHAIGVVANNPMHKGGVLFGDSADKCARFVWMCDAYNVPLVFLADVPGFMIGTQVERQGIIRHGAKMITAVAEATVPKFSVIVRKAYGAGLYAMCGPAFEPDACIALPTASIAVMGPSAAVNAVYFNKIQERPEAERAAYVAKLRESGIEVDEGLCQAEAKKLNEAFARYIQHGRMQLYLVYLGLQALRAPAADGTAPAPAPASLGRIFRDGFVVALFNPKTAIFFAAFLPQFMNGSAPPVVQSIALGALFAYIATRR